jgi:hypothetical protein
MSNHFSTLGFEVRAKDDLLPLIERAHGEGKSFPARHGSYARWEIGQGVELWLGMDEGGAVNTLYPHFSGGARMTVGLTGRIIEDPDVPLQGAFHGWADGLPETGCYPFVFDVPNFDCFDDLQLPTLRSVQLAAFAHEIAVYRDDEDFARSTGDLRVASESFIPIGLFANQGGTEGGTGSRAAFSGHILKYRELINRVHGQRFWSLLVQTYGGIVDVVADPQILNGSPVEGGVVHGSFWLSGRILDSRVGILTHVSG